MKVIAELGGILATLCPKTDIDNRVVEMEIQDSAVIRDLAALLQLPLEKIGPISADGRLIKLSAPIPAGARIKFFQSIAGG